MLGFEIETNLYSFSHAPENKPELEIMPVHKGLAAVLSCRVGHLAYKPTSGEFQYIYADGSVNTEIVTSALPIYKVPLVLRRAIKAVKMFGGMLSPVYGAGLHHTISFNKILTYKDISNVINLSIKYAPALMILSCVRYHRERNPDYFSIKNMKMREPKRRFIRVRYKKQKIYKDSFVVPYLLEFRYPDSNENVNQITLHSIFIEALCRYALRNHIILTDEDYNSSVRIVNRINKEKINSNTASFIKDNLNELFMLLKNDIAFYANVARVKRALAYFDGHLRPNFADIPKIL